MIKVNVDVFVFTFSKLFRLLFFLLCVSVCSFIFMSHRCRADVEAFFFSIIVFNNCECEHKVLQDFMLLGRSFFLLLLLQQSSCCRDVDIFISFTYN